MPLSAPAFVSLAGNTMLCPCMIFCSTRDGTGDWKCFLNSLQKHSWGVDEGTPDVRDWVIGTEVCDDLALRSKSQDAEGFTSDLQIPFLRPACSITMRSSEIVSAAS